MNARSIASLAAMLLAMSAFSCSSEATPTVSGGAQFTLRNAGTADNPDKLGACPDLGQQFTVAQRGEDGKLKLVLNGADDARVVCRISDTKFDVTVSRAAASFTANGTISGGKSTDAFVQVATDTNRYKTIKTKCTIEIDENGGGRFRGRVTCPLLEHATSAYACASTGEIGADDKTKTYFSFANCDAL